MNRIMNSSSGNVLCERLLKRRDSFPNDWLHYNQPMKYALIAAVLTLASPVFALDGQIGIHDPSTVIQCDGKYYVWGTGGNPLVSDDGWTWSRGTPAARSTCPRLS